MGALVSLMALISMEFGWFLVALSLGGAGYALLAGLTASRFMRTPSCGHRSDAPVTILKPLYLGEPGLQENLESFFAQDFSAPVQIVFGVHDQADPAIEVVQALQAKYPGFDTCIVAEPAMYGPNAKVSNLINMIPAAKHGILILSDSDIRVPHNWLTEVTGALARPGVGLVTCLYKGEAGGRGLWPTLAAMGTSYDFLPNVVTGVSLGLAEPCMGSTIALTRDVLEKIGGFDAFASYLADDYEMGRAVRKLGLELAIPALGVGHSATETSVAELVNHELRWNRTIRRINPAGHIGSIITFTVPLALMAAVLLDFRPASLAVLGIALGARLFLKYRIDRIFATNAGPAWILPLRDVLSFGVFVASLWGETVQWRGTRLSVERSGVLSSDSVEALQ
jgi:ceramide glucosyltransferase